MHDSTVGIFAFKHLFFFALLYDRHELVNVIEYYNAYGFCSKVSKPFVCILNVHMLFFYFFLKKRKRIKIASAFIPKSP